MRALCFEEYGPPSVLKVVEREAPLPGPGEVLVQIMASAINPSDVKNVSGAFKSPLPRIPGRDYAGVVVKGDSLVGLQVWGSGAGFGVLRDGSHTEYMVVPTDSLSEKPRNLSMAQAASVGIPYVTAWSTLIKAAELRAGEVVLVVGVSGSVGQAATQIAHLHNARVIGAARQDAHRSGADLLINPATGSLPDAVRAATAGRGVDVVLDTVGGAMFEPALKSLALGGRHIAITSAGERRVSLDLVDFYHNQSRLLGVDTMKLSGSEIAGILGSLRPAFEDGRLVPPEIATSSLDGAVKAYEETMKGSPKKQILVFG
jgi:NADPH:quinone reductase-like Zn-dependent oxidoreductase